MLPNVSPGQIMRMTLLPSEGPFTSWRLTDEYDDHILGEGPVPYEDEAIGRLVRAHRDVIAHRLHIEAVTRSVSHGS